MPQIEVPLAAGKNRCKASYADEPVQKGAGEESRFGDQRFTITRKANQDLDAACLIKSICPGRYRAQRVAKSEVSGPR